VTKTRAELLEAVPQVLGAGVDLAVLGTQFAASMVQLGIAMSNAAQQFTDALIPTWERVITKARAAAYGTLRSWGVPHWIAKLVSQRCPVDWVFWLADRGG